MKNKLRTLWVVLLALGLGFAVSAQQQVNNFTVKTNLSVGGNVQTVTLNGYNVDAIVTNSAASVATVFAENLQSLLSEASPSVAKLAFVLNDDSNGDATRGTYRYDPTLSGPETATVWMCQDKGGNTSSLGRWVRMSAGDNYQMSVDTLDDALAVSPAYLAAGINPTNSFKLTVKTRARKALGRGGAATYRYSATAPASTNLGSVVPYGSGYLVADPEGGVINVRQFGAYGDGVTDDTAALDSARDWAQNAARTSGVSTVLYLPRGNYLHSGNFTIAGQVKLKGDGLETSGAGNGTTIVCTGDNTPAVSVSGQGFAVEDIEIRYQTFQDSTKTNSVTLKFAGDTYKYSIRNVAVRAGYDSIAAAQSINVYNGTVDNLFVRSYSHSGVRMLSGGTVNTWNNLYVQNLANVQVTQTATITNVALANGTNITLTCSGSLPPLLATNRQFVISGLDSGYNGNFFVRAISGSVVYCDAASTLSAPSDINGTLTFYAQPATGYPIELGNGEHTFVGLDVEHVVTDAAAIIYAPSLSYVHIVDAHIEAVYRSSGGLYLVHSPNGSVTVDSLSFINSGFNPGSDNYTFRNGSTMASLIGGNVTARDIAFTGANWYTGSAASGADYPMVASVKAATTYRANATGTPTGDGSLRYALGGGNKAVGSSGTDNIFNWQPTVTESGTARYFGWMINPTASTLGSGISYPLWVGENSTNYYRVSNRGSHVTEADVAQTARFMKREDTGDEVALSYGSSTDRKTTFAANSQDTVVKSTSAAAAYTINPSGGALVTGGTIELGHASDTTLARSAAGKITVEGNEVPSPASPSTGQIIVYTNSTWAAMTPGSSGVGGSTGSVDNRVLRADGTGGSTVQNSAVFIDDFTSSTANNVAIRVDDGTTANISAVITPKGTGAFIVGPKPDGTGTGGNARGQYAVDVQPWRDFAGAVASGNSSVAVGTRNTASALYSVAIGFNCWGAAQGAVAVGEGNTASGVNSFASGLTSTASGAYSFAHGFFAQSPNRGQFSISGGNGGSSGGSQSCIATVYRNTTATTQVVLSTDGSTGTLALPNNTAWTFEAKVTGITSAAATVYSYILTGVITRGANAASTSMPAAVTKVVVFESNAAADADAVADTTNGALSIRVTPFDTTATRWSATVQFNQVTF